MASPSILRIERLNYGIGAVAIAVTTLTQSLDIALGLAIGVLLTCANFFVLRKLVTKWTREAASGKGGNASLLMLPKMIGLMGSVAVVIIFLPVNVVAFTIGYSIFIVSIIVDATYSTLRISDSEPPEPNEPNEHNHG
jgi:hypothetical protein